MFLSPFGCREGLPHSTRHGALGLGLTMLVSASSAQDVASNRPLAFLPSLAISETLTDNRELSAVNKQSELITQVSPSIRLSTKGGTIQGTLDYTLNAYLYSRDSSRKNVQNALSANFVAEPIERHVFVDARAFVGQHSISAYGVQAPTPYTVVSNRTEVRSFTLSPYLRGRIGTFGEYEARWTWGKTSNGVAGGTSNSTNSQATLRASGGNGTVGWSTDLTEGNTDFQGGRKTTDSRVSVGINYRPDPDLRLNARAGRERSNVLSVRDESTSSSGVGLDWTPSVRTQISAQADRRYFGNGHSLTFQHRMASTVWRYTDSRDISSDSVGNRGTAAVQTYDQLFIDYATQIPDRTLRDIFVRSLLANQAGFLTGAITVQRRREATASWLGLRANASLTAFASESQRADGLSAAVDDLSRVGGVRQHGYNVNVGYRLSPTSSVNFGHNRSSTANSAVQRGNDQRGFSLAWSAQIERRVSLGLNLRHVNFESAIQPYTENGATATLSLQF
jgi:uncharacterized protein (PEP-CTERM system associated)